MKKTLLAIAIATGAALSGMAQTTTPAPRQMPPRLPLGVGPVMQASMTAEALPAEAQAFLTKYFPGVAVLKTENDFKDRRYEVKLADGAEVAFDYNGNWIEVEAPDGAMLPSSTLAALMPESVVESSLSGDALMPGGVMEYVEEVTAYPDFYIVEVRTPEGMKTRAALSKADGTAQVLSQKSPKGYGHTQAYKSDKARKDKKGKPSKGKRDYGRAMQARFDHNPRFY